MREAVIFDTEFTAWEGSLVRQWPGPGEHRDLVQIGAVRIEPHSLAELAAFAVLVKPARNPALAYYFSGLTGLTGTMKAMAEDAGPVLRRSLQRILPFCCDANTFCLGLDASVLHSHARLNGLHACHLANAAGADFGLRAHDALTGAAASLPPSGIWRQGARPTPS